MKSVHDFKFVLIDNNHCIYGVNINTDVTSALLWFEVQFTLLGALDIDSEIVIAPELDEPFADVERDKSLQWFAHEDSFSQFKYNNRLNLISNRIMTQLECMIEDYNFNNKSVDEK